MAKSDSITVFWSHEGAKLASLAHPHVQGFAVYAPALNGRLRGGFVGWQKAVINQRFRDDVVGNGLALAAMVERTGSLARH